MDQESPPHVTPPEASAGERLDSWKEIAAHLKRGVRTVQRWEEEEGLPVRRHGHQRQGSVYAYKPELDAWWNNGRPGLEQEEPAPPARRRLLLLWWPALAVLVIVAAGLAAWRVSGRHRKAREDGPSRIAVRRVWAGPGVDLMGGPSPDGRYLSFVDWSTGDLAVRDLVTGTSRRLTNKGPWHESSEYAQPSCFSPDGRQVAYGWHNRDSSWELRAIGLDNSSPRVVYRDDGLTYVRPFGWSPDSQQILARLSRREGINQIALFSVADGSVRILKTADSRRAPQARISPDGRFIAFDFPPQKDSESRDIFLLSADGSKEVTLVDHPAHDVLLDWFPDGKAILFASNRTGTWGAWSLRVEEGRVAGDPKVVTLDLGPILPLGLIRNGSFFYGLRKMTEVYVATLDAGMKGLVGSPSGATPQFMRSHSGPAWSPDGRSLAFLAETGVGGGRIFGHDAAFNTAVVRSLESGQEREIKLRIGAGPWGRARWTPEGRSIVVGPGWDGYRLDRYYQIDLQTGQARAVELGSGAAWDLSSDGRVIYTTRDNSTQRVSRFLARNLETGQEKQLCRNCAASTPGSLAVSPDGRWLAFASVETGAGGATTSLRVMPAGGEAREILRLNHPKNIGGLEALAWMPDARSVLFVKQPSEQSAEIWRVSAEGGETHRLGVVTSGRVRHLRVHPDGRRIVFAKEQPGGEVWVMENLMAAHLALR